MTSLVKYIPLILHPACLGRTQKDPGQGGGSASGDSGTELEGQVGLVPTHIPATFEHDVRFRAIIRTSSKLRVIAIELVTYEGKHMCCVKDLRSLLSANFSLLGWMQRECRREFLR